MSQVNLSQQHQQDLSLLKLACYVASQPEGAGRPITPKDLDHMTSDDMVAVMSAILSHCDPTFQERRNSSTGVLQAMERLGFGQMTYDCSADLVFRAAQRLFPPGDERLDLGVILMPQLDIRRAKQVIVYLAGYLMALDNMFERFEEEWISLNKENQEKSKLFQEIEELRNTIAEEIVTLQRNKDSKPEFEQELKEIEGDLYKKLSYLSSKEDICKAEKRNYEDKALVNRRLDAELQHLTKEKARLESRLVSCPAELEQFHKSEQQKLKEDQKRRDVLGMELRDLGQKVQFLTKVVERAKMSLKRFEELNIVMHRASENLETTDRAKITYEEKVREIEDVQQAISQLELDQDRLRNEIDRQRKFHAEEYETLYNVLSGRRARVEDLQFKLDEALSRIEEMESYMTSLSENLKQNLMEVHQIKDTILKDCATYQKYMITFETLYWRGIQALLVDGEDDVKTTNGTVLPRGRIHHFKRGRAKEWAKRRFR